MLECWNKEYSPQRPRAAAATKTGYLTAETRRAAKSMFEISVFPEFEKSFLFCGLAQAAAFRKLWRMIRPFADPR